MPFTCEFNMMDGYLRVTTKGTLASVEEVEAYINLVRDQATARSLTRVLLDEHDLMDQQDILDAYDFSESEVTRRTAQAGIRLASVSNPDNYEINKTYETLLLNRPLIFRVFLDEQEAIDWLLS